MLREEEFDNWCQRNRLSASTKNYINVNIREADPERTVGGGGGKRNVSGRYPSKKMGVTIQYESRTVEGPAVYMMENDENILEFYDQPNKITLNFFDEKNNRKRGIKYTPDFFVIKNDEAGWEEWKTEDELIKLSKEKPWRYIRDEQGNWRCPPGEAVASEKGLFFRVRSDNEINWTLQRNLNFLDSFLRKAENLDVEDTVKEKITQYIYNEKRVSLKELIFYAYEMDIKVDTIYICLIKRYIYINLSNYLLSSPENVPVFLRKEQDEIYSKIINTVDAPLGDQVTYINLNVGSIILWDDVKWKIINKGTNNISLKSNSNIISLSQFEIEELIKNGDIKGETSNKSEKEINNKAIDIVLSASENDLITANNRLLYVKQYMDGKFVENPNSSPKSRTVRDWVKSYKEAKTFYGYGLVGLIPKDKNKGNRTPRFNDRVKQLLNDYISKFYEEKTHRNKISVYKIFKAKCEELSFDPPTYQTFCKFVKLRPREESVSKRRGPRAGYQERAFYWEIEFEKTPRHGEFSFDICHLDHTKLDIELVSSTSRKGLGRPYLSLMMDAFNRRVLAFYLSFFSPSYRSCMMVERECVRRFNRIPESLIVDNGKEFHSTYFQTLQAMYECDIKYRPAREPRVGSVLERLFGVTNTNVINNLPGNTQIMKEVRIVTKSFNPKNNAKLTLAELHKVLEYYFFEIYDTTEHPALDGLSPREAYEASLIYGEREHRYIPYDSLFKILTLPTNSQGEGKVQPLSGIKLNYRNYWNDKLADPKVENTKVSIRYDPFNLGLIYAYIGKEWIQCKCKDYYFFKNLTEREAMFISAEMRKKDQNYAKNYLYSAEKTSEFIKELDKNESYSLMKLRVDEEKEIYGDAYNTTNRGLEQSDLSKIDPIKLENTNEQPMEEGVILIDNLEEENPLDAYISDEEEEISYDIYFKKFRGGTN